MRLSTASRNDTVFDTLQAHEIFFLMGLHFCECKQNVNICVLYLL